LPYRATRRKPCVMEGLRHILLRSLVAMLCVVALVQPAAALDAHAVAHWTAPVAAGEHHHHDHDGRVVVEHHHHDEHRGHDAPAERDDRITPAGHAHMAAPAGGMILPQTLTAPEAVAEHTRLALRVRSDRIRPDMRPPPQDRPPRTV
jgi:hypothetical protein